jgi:hypothetical protein
MARLKGGRPQPRWMRATLSKRRKAASVGRRQGLPDDLPTDRPMDIEALSRIVRSVAEAGFGSGPRSLEARLRDAFSLAGPDLLDRDADLGKRAPPTTP